jgi:hypothetical protein
VISRDIKVAQGRGKLIIAACTPSQLAYEKGSHGLFTHALLEGLRGSAASGGDVTINSLYDYIARDMERREKESDQQRPMMSGTMEGRVVLMHLA